MRDPSNPRMRRRDVVEIALPLRRVWALSKAAPRRGIKHRLDASAYPACRFRLLGPDRLEHLHDEPGVDRGNRPTPNDRIDVGCEVVLPLLPVLRIAPACSVLFYELGRALTKRAALRDSKAVR